MTFVSACFAAAVAALAAAVDNPSLEPDLNKKACFFLTQFKRGLSNCPALFFNGFKWRFLSKMGRGKSPSWPSDPLHMKGFLRFEPPLKSPR